MTDLQQAATVFVQAFKTLHDEVGKVTHDGEFTQWENIDWQSAMVLIGVAEAIARTGKVPAYD